MKREVRRTAERAGVLVTEREKLQAELAKIATRSRKRGDQARLDRQRVFAIESSLRKLDLAPLVGVSGGVMIRTRGWERRIPDEAIGTLIKLARTNAHVDFGEHGRWNVPFDHVIATADSDRRGYTLDWLTRHAAKSPPKVQPAESTVDDSDRPF